MEVHQDVFLAILKRWHRYDGEVKWPNYLYRMTIRKALHQAKAMRKTAPIEHLEENLAAGGRPEGPLVARELEQRLTEQLHMLPVRQAEVFVLHRIEGLSYSAIAEGLSCSESTVRVHLYRALKRLDRGMRDYLK